MNSPRCCRNTFCKNLSQVIKLQGEAVPHLARHLIPFTKAINAQLIIKWIEVNTGANSAHWCTAAICHHKGLTWRVLTNKGPYRVPGLVSQVQCKGGILAYHFKSLLESSKCVERDIIIIALFFFHVPQPHIRYRSICCMSAKVTGRWIWVDLFGSLSPCCQAHRFLNSADSNLWIRASSYAS